ncbi:uncharacterized protein LOC110721036 [Chenopodium quinoa]|uniref:Uncharacterized protein n=1 Tax=Chenopodium quinoa TaxID=63459 RepID=A0A803LYJ9_CHEQI|nr:uncharacterized protein LOC110721036 [Chenopodium quinoa]
MTTNVKLEGDCYGRNVFSLGLIATTVVVCLLLQPTATNAFMVPSTYMEEFTVFAIKENSTTNSSRHNTIHFELWFNNRERKKGVYYDALNLTFYYKPNDNISSLIPIGNATIKSFYQRSDGSDWRRGDFEVRGVKWESITASPVIFRVELVTMLRHDKMFFRKSKRERYEVGADLKVNDQGDLMIKKWTIFKWGIELTSSVGRNYMGSVQLIGMFVLFVFYFW